MGTIVWVVCPGMIPGIPVSSWSVVILTYLDDSNVFAKTGSAIEGDPQHTSGYEYGCALVWVYFDTPEPASVFDQWGKHRALWDAGGGGSLCGYFTLKAHLKLASSQVGGNYLG
ncbi:hypothetical protein CBL_05140 [Carabus blaptoides fortunei]